MNYADKSRNTYMMLARRAYTYKGWSAQEREEYKTFCVHMARKRNHESMRIKRAA